MGELDTLLRTGLAQTHDGPPLALATVVHVEGSTYRRPGARMLIAADRTRIGSVSGGCLEADVVEHALHVIATGKPKYLLYDNRGEHGDVIFELGCKGAVGILIERVAEDQAACGLRFMAECRDRRQSGLLATVFRVQGACQVTPGERMMLPADGDMSTSIMDAHLRNALALELHAMRSLFSLSEISGATEAVNRSFELPDGIVDVLLEPILPPVALLLCGAGQDAIPVAHFAGRLGWRVTVLDHRATLLTSERFPEADTLLEARPERFRDVVSPDHRTVAVIMSHHLEHDRDYLEGLLPSPVRYIGLLGPRRRAEQLLEALELDHEPINEKALGRLHNPAGLDIGSETPDEIALAIVAEIQAVLSERKGGFLRDRRSAIHVPEEPTSALTGKRRRSRLAPERIRCPLSV